jgi:hypothetical protein
MSPPDRLRRAARASASLAALVVAVLIPKCPLCVAAALSALGLGATLGSWLAPAVRPLGLGLAVAGLLVFARSEWHRRRRGRMNAIHPAHDGPSTGP